MQNLLVQAYEHSFMIGKIADRVHSKNIQIAKQKQQKQSQLSISKIFSINGKSILHLFGSYLSQKVGDSSFVEIAKQRTKFPWIFQQQLHKYINIFWPDCGKYQKVIPVLFSILKNKGGVYLTDLDMFIEISRKSMNQFSVTIKQSLSPLRIEQLIRKIKIVSQRQDIFDSGTLDKIIMDSIFKEQMKNVPVWPKQLICGEHQNKINYQLLLSQQYLNSGKQIDQFLKGHLTRKIIRCLKKASQVLKQKKKSSPRKLITKKRPNPNKLKVQKAMNQFIEANKVKKLQDPNKLKFIAKSLINQLIQLSVDVSENQKPQIQKSKTAKKSVYITEPTLAQIQHEQKDIEQFRNLAFTENSGLGILVSGSSGRIVDPVHQKLGAIFTLQPSKLFKQSPIISYRLDGDILYAIQQNGLLFSWSIHEDIFQNQIQTSLKKKQPKIHPNNLAQQEYMQIADGIIFINCTHCQAGLIEFYKQQTLEYIGSTLIKSQDYQIKPEYLQQSYQMSQKILKKLPIDKKIGKYSQYLQILTQNGYNFDVGTQLGQMMCNYYKNQYFTVNQLNYIIEYVQQYEKSVKIIFPESIQKNIMENSPNLFNEYQKQYLQKLGYISESTQSCLQEFISKYCKYVEYEAHRKQNLLALFQDNNLLEIPQRQLTIDQFKIWIAPACLMKQQLAYIIDNVVKFTPNGKVNMIQILRNQHYNRIIDHRRQRYLPQNYKKQYLPPAIINHFQPIPSHQIFIYTLKFPIAPKFYVGSLITGRNLKIIDMQSYTTKQIKLSICPRNGYYCVIANRSIQLWSKESLNNIQKKKPNKQWIQIESQPIIALRILHENNTIITLTKSYMKIWDLQQLLSHKEQRPVFTLKPGYKAVQKNSKSGASNFKKIIYFRGNPIDLYTFRTPNSLTVCTILSNNKQNILIKSFYINKFHIVLNRCKYYEQVPTKLIRQLQELAIKKRRIISKKNKRFKLSKQQSNTINYIVAQFDKNLKKSNSSKIVSCNRQILTKKLNRLSNDLCNIYTNKNMFIDHQNKSRIQLIFSLITISTKSDLPKIVKPQFIKQYTDKSTKQYSLSRIISDSLSLKQVKNVNRILYFLSLVQKYSRPLIQQSQSMLIRLISMNKFISQHKILQLFPKQCSIQLTIIQKCIKTINTFSNPVENTVKIIRNYIPTRYRFLCPRYLKQICRNKPSPQLNQYLSNRYQMNPSSQELVSLQQSLTHNPIYPNINEFIADNSLYSFVAHQIIPNCPEAQLCNYSLIESLFAHKKLTQKQAIYFTLKQTDEPTQRFSTNRSENSHKIDYNSIGYKIAHNIKSRNIQSLPSPIITFQYYKNNLYDEEYDVQFFYNYLKGQKTSQTIMTEILQKMMSLIDKGLLLKYDFNHINSIMNYHNTTKYPIMMKQTINQLIQRIPKQNRIITALELKGIIMNFIVHQSDYEQLSLRCAYACSGKSIKKQQWENAHTKLNNKLTTQGMWVNINYLIKYLSEFNPYLLPKENPLQIITQTLTLSEKINVPSYYWYKIMEGQHRLFHINHFRQVLSHNMGPLSLKNIDKKIASIYKYESKHCYLSDLNKQSQQIFKFNPIILGQILLNKYYRSQYEYKFTFIDHHVPSKQLIQLINSKMLVASMFTKSDNQQIPQFLDYQSVMKIIRVDCIKPALDKYSQIFIAKTKPEIINLIAYQIEVKSVKNMPIANLVQLLQQNQSDHNILMCLVRYLSSQNDNSLTINIQNLLKRIRTIQETNKVRRSYQQYKNIIKQKINNRNQIQIFLQYARPINFPFCLSPKIDSDVIVHQHLQHLISTQLPNYWYLNYQPYANVTTFLQNLHPQISQQLKLDQIVNFFYYQIVNRLGIQILMEKLGTKPNFAQFYYTLKSQSKSIIKYPTSSLLLLYQKICQKSEINNIEQIGILQTIQQYIPISSKIQWICSIYDRQLINQPLQHQQFYLDTQYKLQKVKILAITKIIPENQQQKQQLSHNLNQIVYGYLRKSLNYEKYLLHKCLGDDIRKISEIYKGIVDQDYEGVHHLMDIAGVTNPFYQKILIDYIFKNYDELKRAQTILHDEVTQDVIVHTLQIIEKKCKNLNFPILPEQNSPQNYRWHTQLCKQIAYTKIYQKYLRQHTISKYYNTFHTYQQFLKKTLKNLHRQKKHRNKIISLFEKFIKKNNISLQKLYELLGFCHYENIVKYFPYCLSYEDQAIDCVQARKYVRQIFYKNYKNGSEIKYPIGFEEFCQIFVDQGVEKDISNKNNQVYQELDYMGAGYVNINDIQQYRGSLSQQVSPYIRIPTYLQLKNNKIQQKLSLTTHISQPNYFSIQKSQLFPQTPLPPTQISLKNKIKQKLLQFQLPSYSQRKFPLIDKNICMAILGEYGFQIDHNLIKYFSYFYEIKTYQKFNLTGILNWLYEYKGSLPTEQQSMSTQKVRRQKIQKFIEQVEQKGGVISYSESIMPTFKDKPTYDQFLQDICQIYPKQQDIVILSMISSSITLDGVKKLVTQIVDYGYRQYMGWSSRNNEFCYVLQNMSQFQYSLINRFYYAHCSETMYHTYHQISTNGQLTFFTLWQHIEHKGITGYSRGEVQALFDAIDINGDRSIQCNQFYKFWMAAQQIFPKSIKDNYKPPINTLIHQIQKQFLMLCLIDLEKYHTEELQLGDLQKLVNIRNIDKIDRILRSATYSESKGVGSGAIDTALLLQRSKIKIMTQKMKNNILQQTDTAKFNHFLKSVYQQLAHFSTSILIKQNLTKIVLAKYPNFGHRIIQQIQQLTGMDLTTVKKLLNQHKKQQSITYHENKQQIMESSKNIINQIQQYNRKHVIKARAYQHVEGGGSLARGFIENLVIKAGLSCIKQIQQLQIFVIKLQPIIPQIGYDIEQDMIDPQNYQELNDNLTKYQANIVNLLNDEPYLLEIKPHHSLSYQNYYSINRKIALNNQFICRVIQWDDTDFICKSQNKVNLLQNCLLYNDPQISILGALKDRQSSNRFKLIGYGKLSKQKQYCPIINKITIQRTAISKIIRLMYQIANKLYYCYCRYQVSGLLVMPSNILISQYDHTDIKFDHFLTALTLDLTSTTTNSRLTNNQSSTKSLISTVKQKSRSYVDGIDSKIFIKDVQFYPPQIDSGIYTQAIDVYQLAHIIYKLFRKSLVPQSMNKQQRIGYKQRTLGISTDDQSIWQSTSYLHQISSQIIGHPQNLINLSTQQKVFWGLMYECSYYEWYMRPKLYQIRQLLQNLVQTTQNNPTYQKQQNQIMNKFTIFKQESISQYVLSMMDNQDNIQIIEEIFKKKDNLKGWSLLQLIEFRQKIGVLSKKAQINSDLMKYIGSFYVNYNQLVSSYLQQKHQQLTQIDNAKNFMNNVVGYLLMPPPKNNSLCLLTISLYKAVLSTKQIIGYLEWCDQNWKINQFVIQNKLEQVNMVDRLTKLHNNSSYYHDLTTLAQCRTVLATPAKANKTNTSHKVAISFIYSSITSNNINKIYALYKSQIIRTLYLNLDLSSKATDQQQILILRIYEKISQSLNPTKHINRFKAVNEVYKIMMVIFNNINSSCKKISPKKSKGFTVMKGTKSKMGQSINFKNSNKSYNLQQNSYLIARNSSQKKPPQSQIMNESNFSPIRTLLQSKIPIIHQNSGIKSAQNPAQSSSSVISMLDFMNNYYTLGGQQCKQTVLSIICMQQLCNLPSMMYLLNLQTLVQNKVQKIYENIIINLSFSEKIEKMMRCGIVSNYQYKLKENYKNNKEAIHRVNKIIQQSTSIHQQTITICELASTQYQRKQYPQLINNHLKFYSWFINYYSGDRIKQLPYKNKINTHKYLLGFLSKSQKVCTDQLPFIQKDPISLKIVILVIKAHRIMFDIWSVSPSHNDYISATIRFLMKTLEQIYSQQEIYIQNKAFGSIIPDILHIMGLFWQPQKSEQDIFNKNLIKIAIDNGYIHFYCRIVKKQHKLLLKFIDKNVQNIHLIQNYPIQAEFRLINFYNFLKCGKIPEYQTQTQQILLSNGFIKYIFEKMFVNQVYMDLRFFKASNIEIVPYRFCNPLKSQAITMIGFVLSPANYHLSLPNQFISRIIPHLLEQARTLTQWNQLIQFGAQSESDQKTVMKVIETFWLLATLCDNQDSRLRYEIMNLQINQIIKELIENYSGLSKFFPKLIQTIYN